MTDTPLPHSLERSESPSVKYYGGGFEVTRIDGKLKISMKVDGEPRTFDIPEGVDVVGVALPLVLQSQQLTYSPELRMFHSLRYNLVEQARQFSHMSFAEMFERVPETVRGSFDREVYLAVKEFATKVVMRWSVAAFGSVLKLGMYSIFLHNTHKNAQDFKSYMKDLFVFAGFEAWMAAPRLVSAGVWRAGFSIWAMQTLSRRLPWVAKWVITWALWVAGAMGAEKAFEKLAVSKKLWRAMPDRYAGVIGEWANSVIGNALALNLSTEADDLGINVKIPLVWAIATSQADATQSPVEYTAQSFGRNRDTWNKKLESFEKRVIVDVAALLSDFYEWKGDFKGSTYDRRYEILSAKLLEKLGNGVNDDIHPMFRAEVVDFVNSTVVYVQQSQEHGTTSGVINNIEADYLRQLINAMKMPAHFGGLNDSEVYSSHISIDDMITSTEAEGQAIIDYRKNIHTDISDMFNVIRVVYPDESIEWKFLRTCVPNIMSWKAPFVENKESLSLWKRLLDNDMQTVVVGDVNMSAGDAVSHLFDLSAEFRQINKWMHLVNKNGAWHEWRFAPEGSVAGGIEDVITHSWEIVRLAKDKMSRR